MKKFGILIVGMIAASMLWMGFQRVELPPVPVICAEISKEVSFNFSINQMDYSSIELGLAEKVNGKGMYVQFKMANAWKTGRPGLVIAGVKPESAMKGGMSPDKYLKDEKRKSQGGKDFSEFMKDKKGKPLGGYTFKQAIVEDEGGKTFMRMTYAGPPMAMIQTLEVPRPITLPAHVSSQFIPKGIIQFQPGTVSLDSKINGFYIPVAVR